MKGKSLIALLIVLALGYWWYSGRTTTPGTQQTGESAVQQTLRDLIAGGQAVMCSYTDTTESTTTEGTVYVAGERMRGDFTQTSDGTTTTSHMIAMNKTSYVWMDGQQNGYMMMAQEPEETEATETAEETPESQEPVDLDRPLDYNCQPWSVDEDMFGLPDGINFIDMNAMMEQGTEAMQDAIKKMAPEEN